ncbi:hypothetical protein ACO2Q3_12590 [Caulobacter sp. KR2-114]|uniref:hypothetical protein n=1 Tax=Caulobacter sp. KR2-114 TaxID=3400912 RepID=UPI003C060DE3
MINEAISRLARATESERDDPALTRLARQAMRRFAASLSAEHALILEEILQSMARAAEELPDDATPFEIRDRARLMRRQRH